MTGITVSIKPPLRPWYLDANQISEVHNRGFTGNGASVTVVESCINFEMPSLLNKNLTYVDCSNYNYASSRTTNHGTAVAGVISGSETTLDCSVASSVINGICSTHPQLMLSGVMPDVQILNVPFNGTGISCADASRGIQVTRSQPSRGLAFPKNFHARTNVILINLSGGSAVTKGCAMDLDIGINSVQNEWRELISNGYTCQSSATRDTEPIIFIAALGNDGKNLTLPENDKYRLFPAAITKPKSARINTHIISVGGLDPYFNGESPKIWPQSNYGHKYCDVLAPAAFFNVLIAGDPYKAMIQNGTSLAAPLVSGTLAGMKVCKPHATPKELVDGLLSYSDHDSNLMWYVRNGTALNVANVINKFCTYRAEDLLNPDDKTSPKFQQPAISEPHEQSYSEVSLSGDRPEDDEL